MYLIAITANYVTTPGDLSGGEYTIGDSLYLNTDKMQVTNNVADALTTLGSSGGVIGTCQEAPDVTESNDRMVIRLEEDADLVAPLMRLLQASSL